MLLFPWNWDNFKFFLLIQNNSIYRTNLMNKLNNVGNTITPLKQNDCNPVWGQKPLSGHKNSDRNGNQSTFFATIKSIRCITQFNELLFLSNSLTILDKLVYKIIFRNSFILSLLYYFCLRGNRKGVSLYCLILYSYQTCFGGSLLLLCFEIFILIELILFMYTLLPEVSKHASLK